MFVWVQLPASIDADALLAPAVARKMAFVPGTTFFVGEIRRNFVRLNFSNQPPPMISEGMQRFGQVIEAALADGPA
jgi:2-aminoadipate transaminase